MKKILVLSQFWELEAKNSHKQVILSLLSIAKPLVAPRDFVCEISQKPAKFLWKTRKFMKYPFLSTAND